LIKQELFSPAIAISDN